MKPLKNFVIKLNFTTFGRTKILATLQNQKCTLFKTQFIIDGWMVITDRKKQLIILPGHWKPNTELEQDILGDSPRNTETNRYLFIGRCYLLIAFVFLDKDQYI